MAEIAAIIITISLFIILLVIIFNGIVRIIRKHFWLGLLMFILLTPLFLIWAFIEGLFGS